MQKKENNYAFIDSQNIHRGIKELGWNIDWERFRKYLKEKYSVSVAYLFIGYIPEHNNLYGNLQRANFILEFKPTLSNQKGEIKGNVDADMVLKTILQINEYDKAIIISSDGDFYSLVRHLYENKKLKSL